MPTAFLLEKLATLTVAAAAAAVTAVTVWATSFGTAAPASVIRNDEFSRPAARGTQPIETVLGPKPGRGMRRVPCAGAVTHTTASYVAIP